MSKELPYFKYFPSEWVTGDITLCSMEAQGVFINLCSYYWMKNCSMCLANAKQRFSKHVAAIDELLEFGIIKVLDDDRLCINFLDEQMEMFTSVSEKRAMAGAVGGKAKAKQMLNSAVAKPSYKEKEKEKEKDINDEFEVFWDKYHAATKRAKEDRAPTLKYWNKLTDQEKEKAISSIEAYSLANPKYCKKARTYLADKNFNDEFKKPEKRQLAL